MDLGNGQKQIVQIGDLAKRAGVSVRAVRYYEELGLIHPETHSIGGFRLYSEDSLKRLQVISRLKDLGLSLMEIRQILLAKKMHSGDRDAVQFLLQAFSDRLRDIESKIEALARVKGELLNAISILRSCENCGHEALLDSFQCRDCASLKGAVPDTIEVILGE
jgi:DNA-binding transcriptional MerR regulator